MRFGIRGWCRFLHVYLKHYENLQTRHLRDIIFVGCKVGEAVCIACLRSTVVNNARCGDLSEYVRFYCAPVCNAGWLQAMFLWSMCARLL